VWNAAVRPGTLRFAVAFCRVSRRARCRAEIDRDDPTDKERGEVSPRRETGSTISSGEGWTTSCSGAFCSAKLSGASKPQGARLATLRKRFEQRLGKAHAFRSGAARRCRSRLAMEMPKADPTLVPPRLLQRADAGGVLHFAVSVTIPLGSKADIEAHFMREYLRDLSPTIPCPHSKGKQRPARRADDPSLRKILLHLLKPPGAADRRGEPAHGRTDDINGLLRELGLAEIDFPPPPRRRAAARVPDHEGDYTTMLNRMGSRQRRASNHCRQGR